MALLFVYSTYLGGHDRDFARAVAVDTAGSAYVTGVTFSSNFPVKSAFQSVGTNDAFVTKFTPAGNAIVYSTFLGGEGWRWPTA